MLKVVIPGYVQACLETMSVQELADKLGTSTEIIEACHEQFDNGSMLPIPIERLKLKPKLNPVTEFLKDPANDSLTITEIALELGVSNQTVSKYLREMNITRRAGRPPVNNVKAPSISELFEHKTLNQLAKFLKIDSDRLMQILK